MCPLSEYLKQMNFILPEHDDFCVSLLDEGFSNQTYHISWPHHSGVVLRIPALNESAFGINRNAEQAIWQKVAAQNLTSKMLWHDGKGAVASEFLLGTTLPWDVVHNQETLLPICEVLYQLHNMPVVPREYDVYSLMRVWLKKVSELSKLREVNFLYQQVVSFYAELTPPRRPENLRLCHNDLNPKNMILHKHCVWLIDWESAGMNDPLFDVAVLAHSHHLTDEQLCTAYQIIFDAELDAASATTITHYRQAYVLRELIWLLLKHLVSGSQDLDCLQWYHSLLADPVFNPYFT